MKRHLLTVPALLAGVVSLSWFQTLDPDAFWHLKVGEVILDTGRMVRTNVFSSSFPDHPWFNPEWLFQVALAQAWRAGGWTGVAVLKTAVACALAAVLYAVLLLAGRGGAVSAAALSLAALAAMRFRLMERPQLVSFLLFALLLLVLELRRTRGDRVLIALPLLSALWGNVHPELVLGLLTLGGVWVGERLDGLRPGFLPPSPWPFGAAIGASLLVSGANPGGFRVLLHPFPHFTQDAVVKISEFAAGSPARAPLFWIVLAAVALALLRPGARREGTRLVPLAGLALLGARYVRETPYFVLAAAPLLQQAVAAGAARGGRAGAARAAAACAAALGFLVFALRYEHRGSYRWGAGVRADRYPVAAAELIAREGLPPQLYNNYNEGGYLLFRLHPRMGVFQDGRISAYPEEYMRALHAGFTGAQWREAFDRYRVNTALVSRDQGVLFFPRQEWAMVFWDERFCVLVRRAAAPAAQLERLEYRFFLPHAGTLDPDDPRALEASLAEMDRSERDRGAPSPELLARRAFAFSRLGRAPAARRTLEDLIAMFPEHAPGWLLLGLTRLDLGDAEGAKEAYRKALRLDPALRQVGVPDVLATAAP